MIKDIKIEIASTDIERSIGLMHRASLPQDYGMLFAFSSCRDHKFWNKNVQFPLSLGFFNPHGELLGVKDMDAQSSLSVSCNNDNVKYVLEANKGFFADNDIKIGSKITNIKIMGEKEEKIGLESNVIKTAQTNLFLLTIDNNVV